MARSLIKILYRPIDAKKSFLIAEITLIIFLMFLASRRGDDDRANLLHWAARKLRVVNESLLLVAIYTRDDDKL